MKAKNRKQKSLFKLLLPNREKILIGCLPYKVSKHFLSLYMLKWQIFGSQQSIQNIVFCRGFSFTSKACVYPMKTRNLFARKLEHFYRDIKPKIEEIAQ